MTSGSAFADSGKLAPELKCLAPMNVNVIVQVKKARRQAVMNVLAQFGARLRPEVNLSAVDSLAVTADSGRLPALAELADVAYVAPDREVTALLDAANPTVGADIAFQSNKTGAGVGIAVIDSGIGIESDRVNEERRVYVKCGQCPPQFHLGEQAEVLITVAHLDRALLVPEAAVQGFDGTTGTVWMVENGQLARRALTFRYRTEDARLEVVGGLPDQAQIVAAPGAGFREGRAARVVAETGK